MDEWHEYRKLVIDTTERHQACIKDLYDQLGAVKVEVALLKLKAGVWGLLAGALPGAIAIAVWLLKEAIKS